MYVSGARTAASAAKRGRLTADLVRLMSGCENKDIFAYGSEGEPSCWRFSGSRTRHTASTV